MPAGSLPDGGRMAAAAAILGLLIEAFGVVVIVASAHGKDFVSIFLVGAGILFNLVALVGLVVLWLSWRRRVRAGGPDPGLVGRTARALRNEAILLGGLTGISAIAGLVAAAAFHATGPRTMGLWAALYSVTGGAATVILLAYSLRRVRRAAASMGLPLG